MGDIKGKPGSGDFFDCLKNQGSPNSKTKNSISQAEIVRNLHGFSLTAKLKLMKLKLN